MKKIRMIFISLMLLVLLILSASIIVHGIAYRGWGISPFKVTDPLDPAFNPSKFSFNDYQGGPNDEDSINTVLGHILKPGMHMEDIDKILVLAGGAKKSFVGDECKCNKYVYSFNPLYMKIRYKLSIITAFDGYKLYVEYDEADLLRSFVLKSVVLEYDARDFVEYTLPIK